MPPYVTWYDANIAPFYILFMYKDSTSYLLLMWHFGHSSAFFFQSQKYMKILKDLGGGFNYFLFSSLKLGKWSNLTFAYFSDGWFNHQLEIHLHHLNMTWNITRILGVSRSAKADDIKRAYRKRSLRFHPVAWMEIDVRIEWKSENENDDLKKAYIMFFKGWCSASPSKTAGVYLTHEHAPNIAGRPLMSQMPRPKPGFRVSH